MKRFTLTLFCAFTLTFLLTGYAFGENNASGYIKLDKNIASAGYQEGVEKVIGIGPNSLVGFAVYALGCDNLKGFTVKFEWASAKAALRSASGPNILIEDTTTINGQTIDAASEENILGSALFSAGETNTPGLYQVSKVTMGSKVTAPAGLVYYALFKTSSTFKSTDYIVISATVTVADENGMERILGTRTFTVNDAPLPESIAANPGPSTTSFNPGQRVTVPVYIDMTQSTSLLGEYSLTLAWPTALLKYAGVSGGTTTGWDSPSIITGSIASGQLKASAINASGTGGKSHVMNVDFDVLSTATGTGTIQLALSKLSAAKTFIDLLPVAQTSGYSFSIPATTLALTSPNGGERWIAGKPYPITWTQRYVSNVMLEYSANSGVSWNLIAASVNASAGSYSWTIPDNASPACLVKATDTSNAAVRDSSDAVFTITRPTVRVLAPNGGEVWTAGSQRTITWTSTDVDSVTVEYSTNGGSAWTAISGGMPSGVGSLAWIVPQTPSMNCLVRVTNRSGLVVSDASDAAFSIIPATVTLTSPNGGESFVAGESHAITWISSGITTVKLEYTTDGLAWVEIAASVNAETGSYSWPIPPVASDKCLVRVTNATIQAVTDRSDSTFTIITPAITLTSPNGGEQWTALRTFPITWESVGIPLAKLEYSMDNGSAWNLIADTVDAKAGSYSWKVPETLSAKCLVRITDRANTNRSDISNGVFTISPPPAVRITAPNGGENWSCMETRNITWMSERVDSLRIEYTLNGGQVWTTLDPGAPAATGLYQWKLPDETSSQCFVRITDVSDSAFTDITDAPFSIVRYNRNADFAVDSYIGASGNQGEDCIRSVGGGKNVGFALYAKEWEAAGEFTVKLSWNPDTASFRSISSPNIVDDEVTINGKTFTPAPETNILGGTLFTAGERNTPGFYSRSFAISGNGAPVEPDGLLYFAVFRTTTEFAVGDTCSIRCEVTVKDPNGGVKDLGARFFRIIPGMQPPANLTVSDVPGDQGHSLKLAWAVSPSESSGMVTYYRIYRSLASALSDSIKPMSMFTDIRDVAEWERHAAVLVDSVSAGTAEYTDAAVGLVGVPYYYWIQAVGAGGESAKIAAAIPTAVKERIALPVAFRLGEARPNPFNPSTTIEYSLPRNTHALLRVYNVTGRKVATLAEGMISAGDHFAVWDARGMPSGVYFYTLSVEGGYSETKKMLLLK